MKEENWVIKAAHLIVKSGINMKKKIIRESDLVDSPMRSCMGEGIVIPKLLDSCEPVVVLDPMQENESWINAKACRGAI